MALTISWTLILAAMLVFVLWTSQATAPALPDALIMAERHESWMAQHGRTYKDAAEKAERLKIFEENVERIESFNKEGGWSYKLGVNKFADMTDEERQASLTGHRMSSFRPKSYKVSSFKYENVTTIPSSMDWREYGAVTGVKNQHHCGCCWAFSAVAAMEGTIRIKTGKLLSLSEQELVDCESPQTRVCINGGNVYNAFEYIMNNNGLAEEYHYPYQGVEGSCMKNEISRAATITDYEEVPANSESALLNAVANQPVSVYIDSKGIDFYENGIYKGKNCGTTDLDHDVTVVGYGETSDGMKYWLIKNSWGEHWGENGYIRMQRDVDAKEGVCGIAMEAAYPII